MDDRRRKIEQLVKDLGLSPELVRYSYTIKVIDYIDSNDGKVYGAIQKCSPDSNAVSQAIYNLIRDVIKTNPDMYIEITGQATPVSPKIFVGRLYAYYKQNY